MHVSVPIPADEVLAVANGNAVYVFWSGNGDEESATKNWAKYLARLFDDAKITSGHMRSHRLRDTFAVDLLQKGVPLEEVSKLLGHSSIKTTEKSYAQWVKGRQDRLNKLVRLEGRGLKEGSRPRPRPGDAPLLWILWGNSWHRIEFSYSHGRVLKRGKVSKSF